MSKLEIYKKNFLENTISEEEKFANADKKRLLASKVTVEDVDRAMEEKYQLGLSVENVRLKMEEIPVDLTDDEIRFSMNNLKVSNEDVQRAIEQMGLSEREAQRYAIARRLIEVRRQFI